MDHSKFNDQKTEYAGGAFHCDLPKGKTEGVITVEENSIRFGTESNSLYFPFRNLEISFGGAADRLIFFKHSKHKDWTIFTSDQTILNHYRILRDPLISKQLASLQKRKLNGYILWSGLFMVLIGVIYGFIFLKEPLLRWTVSKIPLSWETEFGNTLYDQMSSTLQVIDDPELMMESRRILKPLSDSIDHLSYDIQFHIIEDKAVNAFAIPGGHIILNTGFLLQAENPEEIAGVVAHEIAHISCRHGIRQLVNSTGLYLIVQATIGNVGGILEAISENGSFLLTQKFSRDFETEADEEALKYLLNARINPDGMLKFFKKLIPENEELDDNASKNTEELFSFISTHPPTQKRIDNINNLLKNSTNEENYIVFNVDFEAFQKQLKSYQNKSGGI